MEGIRGGVFASPNDGARLHALTDMIVSLTLILPLAIGGGDSQFYPAFRLSVSEASMVVRIVKPISTPKSSHTSVIPLP